MNPKVIRRINQDLGTSVRRVEPVVRLLENGATVPFIARYRKEATGNIDEGKIRDIADRHSYYEELTARRQFILQTIEEQGKLGNPLREKIENCYVKTELEDLYLAYRPKQQTRASVAREKGLEPLADWIEERSQAPSLEEFALRYVDPEKEVATIEAAVDGAIDILAERIAENADLRRWLRQLMLENGKVRAEAISKDKTLETTKYAMYSDFEESVKRIPSHRMLAVRRGAREKILRYSVRIDHSGALAELKSRLSIASDTAQDRLLSRAADDAYSRLLEPSIQNEIRSFLKARADDESIKVLVENLRAKLLAPPAGRITLIGIDPSLRRGSEIAVVDGAGKLLEHRTVFFAGPKKDLGAAETTLIELITEQQARGIVIGKGTGSRETGVLVRALLKKHNLDVFTVVTNDAAASLYAAAKRARREFPKLDLTVRRAISVAKRLQDPLAELVRLDPRSIGVGQYQHDVDQKKLKAGLIAAVESAVNRVGVDLNIVSTDLLRHISGISSQLAHSIVRYRNEHGPFTTREQLRDVPGFGDKTFEQAAGFIRVSDSANPLDRTSIHPESYGAVEHMATSLGVEVTDLMKDSFRLDAIRFRNLEQEVGRFTAADIRDELLRPGRDPRESFSVPRFRDDVREIGDLAEGMELDGVVRNVTDFGAFVDLGINQDGLIHISEFSYRYIADAKQVIHAGDLVKVKVIEVDTDKKRISLSRRAMLPKPQPRPKPKPHPTVKPKVQPKALAASGKSERRPPRPGTVEMTVALKKKTAGTKAETSLEEKIRRLQEKFKSPERR